MNYSHALRYLDSFINYEKRDDYGYRDSFKPERMHRLVSLLGDPHKGIKCIHVAGSKGKGSTSAVIQSILTSAGFRAGLYTSPHLVSFRERIRIGDELIGEDDIGRLTDRLKPAVDGMRDERPTFFELYTALAFLYFALKKADMAVYETGLGGRLDATNVVEPLVSVITPISYEHTHLLGSTLEGIAVEKAGIIKERVVCVSAPQDDEALGAIEKACAGKDANLVLVGRDIVFEETGASDEGETFNVGGLFGDYRGLRMKLLGLHQVINAATAIGAVEALKFSGIGVDGTAIEKGVASARWPGRCELIKGSPRVILDGAQNAASAKALVSTVKRLFKYRRLVLVLGVSRDKDIKGILKCLVGPADSIVLTRSAVAERAMDPAAIRDMITPRDKEVTVTDDVGAALKTALAKAKPQDLVLVTGSLFVVGEARSILVG
jgi:dihydrofolate synthase/folylpolyglutamate synthase